jgi:hypothetical protein
MLRTHLFGALLGASLAIACSKQGEGERCDPNSEHLDCDTGLICRTADQLSISTGQRGVALCCPPDDVVPSVNACSAGARLPEPEDDEDLPPETPPAADAGGLVGDGGA